MCLFVHLEKWSGREQLRNAAVCNMLVMHVKKWRRFSCRKYGCSPQSNIGLSCGCFSLGLLDIPFWYWSWELWIFNVSFSNILRVFLTSYHVRSRMIIWPCACVRALSWDKAAFGYCALMIVNGDLYCSYCVFKKLFLKACIVWVLTCVDFSTFESR